MGGITNSADKLYQVGVPISGLRNQMKSADPMYQIEKGKNGAAGNVPDFAAAADATAQAQKDINAQQTWANRPGQTDAYGNQISWTPTQAIDPATGKPVTKWEQTTTLGDQNQAIYDAQSGLAAQRAQTAAGLGGQVAQNFSQPVDTSGMASLYNFGGPGPVATSAGDSTDFANKAMEATWAAQQPQLQQRRQQTETQLANQGITRGSDAWNQAMMQLDQGENAARLQAYQTGAGIQNQMFNQSLQNANLFNFGQNQQFGQNIQYGNYESALRQQQMQQALQQRYQPLQDINALNAGVGLSGPQFQGFQNQTSFQGPDYMNAMAQQYGAQLNSQAINSQNTAAGLGVVGSLLGSYFGGSGAGAAALAV